MCVRIHVMFYRMWRVNTLAVIVLEGANVGGRRSIVPLLIPNASQIATMLSLLPVRTCRVGMSARPCSAPGCSALQYDYFSYVECNIIHKLFRCTTTVYTGW